MPLHWTHRLLLKLPWRFSSHIWPLATKFEILTHGPYKPHPDIEYCCDNCKCHGRRLYRYYNTFLDHQKLFCRECGEREFPDGAIGFPFDSKRPHQLCGGTLVAAVPCEGEPTYWGYSSVPAPGVAWWDALPQ